MSRIVTDKGFVADDWTGGFTPLEAFDAMPDDPVTALSLPADTDPDALEGRLDGIAIIRVDVAGFADGRGFTLARVLRRMGFAGRLRARGPLLADQYAMARRSGFDEVEIPDTLAARQPAADWAFRSDWQRDHYQARLQG